MQIAVNKTTNPAGLSDQSDPPVVSPRMECGDIVSRSWMTDEFVQQTRHVWSQAYDRDVSVDEAIEILMNVKRLAEVLIKV